nr:MAG TPA: hypothetical protein [Caudoviricetes sp.]
MVERDVIGFSSAVGGPLQGNRKSRAGQSDPQGRVVVDVM